MPEQENQARREELAGPLPPERDGCPEESDPGPAGSWESYSLATLSIFFDQC